MTLNRSDFDATAEIYRVWKLWRSCVKFLSVLAKEEFSKHASSEAEIEWDSLAYGSCIISDLTFLWQCYMHSSVWVSVRRGGAEWNYLFFGSVGIVVLLFNPCIRKAWPSSKKWTTTSMFPATLQILCKLGASCASLLLFQVCRESGPNGLLSVVDGVERFWSDDVEWHFVRRQIGLRAFESRKEASWRGHDILHCAGFSIFLKKRLPLSC